MGKQSVFLLDEVTNGLDASTALQVVKLLQSLAHRQGATVLCALLQPDPVVLSLFDNLMLLASGPSPSALLRADQKHLSPKNNTGNQLCAVRNQLCN